MKACRRPSQTRANSAIRCRLRRSPWPAADPGIDHDGQRILFGRSGSGPSAACFCRAGAAALDAERLVIIAEIRPGRPSQLITKDAEVIGIDGASPVAESSEWRSVMEYSPAP